MTLKAGVILINKNKIALVYRENLNDYTFPKGHLEENETIIECAIRETEEETKRKVKIIKNEEIYIEKYTTPKGEECENHLFLGYDDGKSDNKSTETHPVVWVDFDKVYDKLSYDDLKELWNNIKDEVRKYIND